MDAFVAPVAKGGGKSKGISQTLKRAIWELHVGAGQKEAQCLLCGINKIYATQNSGFQGAHIVARNFFVGDLTIFSLVPSCAPCNNECENMCVLDFLWVRSRVATLRRVIMTIYTAFVTQHAHELAPQERMAWRVLEHLYGPSRYPAGGGIVNTKQIYEIARAEQYAALVDDAAQLAAQQQGLAIQLRALTEAEIRPMKFGF
jgi:hypothetical protein